MTVTRHSLPPARPRLNTPQGTGLSARRSVRNNTSSSWGRPPGRPSLRQAGRPAPRGRHRSPRTDMQPAPQPPQIWTVRALLAWTTDFLKTKGLEEAKREAELLL